MQFSSHLLSFVTVLFISFICAPVAAFAVQWPDNSHFSPTQRHTATTPQPQKLRSVFPQLTWLRDTAIERIFGLPSKNVKNGGNKPSSLSRPTNTQLPATLLAKYGGDVVLRFNLSTAQEEKALAEAADTLFLDVWEFTNNWADIRLRQDDVGMSSSLSINSTNNIRFLHSLDFFPSPSKKHIPI
jgi:extracellular matrix protein 14